TANLVSFTNVEVHGRRQRLEVGEIWRLDRQGPNRDIYSSDNHTTSSAGCLDVLLKRLHVRCRDIWNCKQCSIACTRRCQQRGSRNRSLPNLVVLVVREKEELALKYWTTQLAAVAIAIVSGIDDRLPGRRTICHTLVDGIQV